MPNEKLEKIRKFRIQHEFVAMTGDGINDDPALATTNVGIAVGSGTDVAVETAMFYCLRKILSGKAPCKMSESFEPRFKTWNLSYTLRIGI